MRNYKRSINQAQQLQYEADRSKITSTIVKTNPPIEEIKPPVVEEPVQKEEQPIIEEQQPVIVEPIKVEATGSINITKNKVNG
jgi:hypothetical protein